MRTRIRFFSSLALAVMMGVFGVLPFTVSAANFSDVSETHVNARAIQSLKDAEAVSGYPDGTFKPDAPISRAEALAIVLKASGTAAAQTAGTVNFTDVTKDDWFFPMVQKGVALGKIKGYEDKTFRPHAPVTLPEALALTLSFFNVSVAKIPVDAVIYEGLDTSAWYATRAQYAKDKNLILPNEKGVVDPLAGLTRGQLAEIIFRMRSVQQTGKAFDITENWITTEHIDNFWKLKHPAEWEIFKGSQNSVIWRKDPVAGETETFFTRIWPESARLSISIKENPQNLTAAQYFSKVKAAYTQNYKNTPPKFSETTLSGRSALRIVIPERRIVDAIIALPNKKFLVMYGEYGESPLGQFLEKQLEAVELSYLFVEKPPEPPKPVIPLADRMETLRENILIADKWKDVEALFPDKKLIHTDGIGIGTGPVDYYFSAEANHTIKLERGTGTILNIREGETSAF